MRGFDYVLKLFIGGILCNSSKFCIIFTPVAAVLGQHGVQLLLHLVQGHHGGHGGHGGGDGVCNYKWVKPLTLLYTIQYSTG